MGPLSRSADCVGSERIGLRRRVPWRIWVVGGLALAFAAAAVAAERTRFDDGWRFHLGEVPGASEAAFDDSAWRRVELPHDWSIEGVVHHAEPSLGGGGFFPNGIGWYRRRFTAPAAWRGQHVTVEFEGVCANAEVWINGHSLGTQPYAYTSFRLDVTPFLNVGQANQIAVRVDDSPQPASRWYTGCGIYRHVWLEVAGPARIDPWSVVVATDQASAEAAQIQLSATLHDDAADPSTWVEFRLLDPWGRTVGLARVPAPGAPGEFKAEARVTLGRPELWSPGTPTLYRALVQVRCGDRILDTVTVPFGVRTVEVSAGRGLKLNGRPLRLIGGSVHHDNGPLGSAAFDRAEERRVELLKAAGFNAIRTSHNPPSPAFLAACDRLGMMVIDEAFDGWAKSKVAHDYGAFFHAWWQRDLDAMVRRDRNHPSIILWSIGNEVFERGTPDGFKIARELSDRVRALDSTRPVTAGINGLGKTGPWTQLDPLFASLDVAGYNYQLEQAAADHARLPNRVVLVTESYQSEAFRNWAILQQAPYVIGEFVWSALDYLGEAGIGRVYPPGGTVYKHWEADQYPWHGAECGEVDVTGWRKPASHYRAILWDRGERLYATVRVPSPDGRLWGVTPWAVPPTSPSWTWPGQEGRTLTVEVYSRYDAVRLYLNGRLIGERPTTQREEFRAAFEVPYSAGIVRAVGLRDRREVETFELATAGTPARLRATADGVALRADGQDLSFVTIEVTDRKGRLEPASDPAVAIGLRGPGIIAGIGSGDMTSLEPYFANPRKTFQGRSLVIIRSTHQSGLIELTVSAPGLQSARVVLHSHMAAGGSIPLR